MTTTINADTSAGLISTADTSGILKVQSNGKTTNALAWVNFNGNGSITINAQYNVSSVTRNSAGDYSIAFSTSTSDINYCPNINTRTPSGSGLNGTSVRLFGYYSGGIVSQAPTTSGFRFLCFSQGINNGYDCDYVSVSVFGN